MLKAIANYFTNAGWLLLPPSFKDALVMMAVNVILLAIFALRVYFVGTAQW